MAILSNVVEQRLRRMLNFWKIVKIKNIPEMGNTHTVTVNIRENKTKQNSFYLYNYNLSSLLE